MCNVRKCQFPKNLVTQCLLYLGIRSVKKLHLRVVGVFICYITTDRRGTWTVNSRLQPHAWIMFLFCVYSLEFEISTRVYIYTQTSYRIDLFFMGRLYTYVKLSNCKIYVLIYHFVFCLYHFIHMLWGQCILPAVLHVYICLIYYLSLQR